MKLLPRKTTFFDLFDRQTAHLASISEELRDLWRHFDRLPERQARIKDLEHQCDEITHLVATEMHGAFVTPLDKEDIASLASGLDDIADYIDDAAVRVILYQIPESRREALEMADLLVRSVQVLQTAVGGLRSNREREQILAACRDLHRLEKEADAVYRSALGDLFNTPGVDPIVVLKWKEIYEHLEMAVDQCEDVANVLEAIQLKYS